MFVKNSFHKIIKVSFILYTLSVVIFGMFQMNMGMSTTDGKVNCPFGGHSMAICQMNPMEHIQEWQSMFTILPTQNLLSLLLVLFALLAISKLKFWNRFSIPEPPLVYSSCRSGFANNFLIFNPLKEAFSSGILNPKIF